MKPSHVTGIAVIGIYVSNLQAARKFYTEILGLEDKGEMGPGWMLGLGETSFYLESGRQLNPDNIQMKVADVTICFEVPTVKAAYQEIKAQGVNVAMAYTEYSPDYAVFMIADPDGNVIEIAGTP